MPSRHSLDKTARAALGWSFLTLGLIHVGLTALVGWGPAEFHDPLYGEKLQQLRGRLAQASAGSRLVVVLV